LATCAASYNICFARSWCHTLLLVPEAPFARCAHSSVSVIERHTLFSLSNQKKREKKKRKKNPKLIIVQLCPRCVPSFKQSATVQKQ
jgi:hypothetical protein